MSRIKAGVAAVLVALLAPGLAPAATADSTVDSQGHRGAPLITARPSTDLVDGSQIVVVLQNFSPNSPIGVTECAIPAGFPEVCDFHNGINLTTNHRGFAIGTWNVHQTWRGTDPWTGEELTDVDCTVTQCTIAAANPAIPTEGDTQPIYFR